MYGFTAEDPLLAQLLALNLEIGKVPKTVGRGPGGGGLDGVTATTCQLVG